jgi:hypothetical protein
VEHPEAGVVADVLGGKALLLEVRDELADRPRVHHAAGQLVVADAGRLLEHEHRRRLDGHQALALRSRVVGLDLAHQMDCRRQRGGARPDEENVDLHALAFDLSHGVLS